MTGIVPVQGAESARNTKSLDTSGIATRQHGLVDQHQGRGFGPDRAIGGMDGRLEVRLYGGRIRGHTGPAPGGTGRSAPAITPVGAARVL
ncbi:hypothetical protein GCM10010329_46450 [Streptomyces spiroverticillatus]|uniref:Uncharacterized protein n=1 Tax=Streptomyces finlayi TaxID=67296 RepID=A0A918X094_9ACTN|nr:hypothetical protein GCM10010329_46450 [Streptomyces spiroverticillatus]GHC99750.1 hypothetical protein GCM10010334_43620 [Streptomyces finlayi]